MSDSTDMSGSAAGRRTRGPLQPTGRSAGGAELAARPDWLLHLTGQVLLLLVVAVPLALAVRHGCVDPGPPVDRPVPGTVRADYCDTIAGRTPWLQLVLVPVLLLFGVSGTTRRRSALWGWAIAGLLVTVLGVNALVLLSTEFARTI